MTTPAARGARPATDAARSRLRACRTTSWPCSMRTRAAALPSPSVEPVIKTRDTDHPSLAGLQGRGPCLDATERAGPGPCWPGQLRAPGGAVPGCACKYSISRPREQARMPGTEARPSRRRQRAQQTRIGQLPISSASLPPHLPSHHRPPATSAHAPIRLDLRGRWPRVPFVPRITGIRALASCCRRLESTAHAS